MTQLTISGPYACLKVGGNPGYLPGHSPCHQGEGSKGA